MKKTYIAVRNFQRELDELKKRIIEKDLWLSGACANGDEDLIDKFESEIAKLTAQARAIESEMNEAPPNEICFLFFDGQNKENKKFIENYQTTTNLKGYWENGCFIVSERDEEKLKKSLSFQGIKFETFLYYTNN